MAFASGSLMLQEIEIAHLSNIYRSCVGNQVLKFKRNVKWECQNDKDVPYDVDSMLPQI